MQLQMKFLGDYITWVLFACWIWKDVPKTMFLAINSAISNGSEHVMLWIVNIEKAEF